MNYYLAYEEYRKSRQKFDDIIKKGFFHKHVLAIPYRWKRNKQIKNVIKQISIEQDFPNLAEKGDPNLIVSLTTFPFRIPQLHLVIRSILKQEKLPGKIYLWLSQDEFPEGLASLPQALTSLTPYGLEIVFVPDNIRSHKKYYYVFKKHSDKIVVTLDDDIIYEKETVGRLLKLHKKFPLAVCANHTKKIKMNGADFCHYSEWQPNITKEDCESSYYIGIGYRGILYPPGIGDEMLLNIELAQQLAPFADDLWLKAMQIKREIKVATAAGQMDYPIYIPNSQKVKLFKHNGKRHGNDQQWTELNKYFRLQKTLQADR